MDFGSKRQSRYFSSAFRVTTLWGRPHSQDTVRVSPGIEVVSFGSWFALMWEFALPRPSAFVCTWVLSASWRWDCSLPFLWSGCLHFMVSVVIMPGQITLEGKQALLTESEREALAWGMIKVPEPQQGKWWETGKQQCYLMGTSRKEQFSPLVSYSFYPFLLFS